jgi:hypothetical protein
MASGSGPRLSNSEPNPRRVSHEPQRKSCLSQVPLRVSLPLRRLGRQAPDQLVLKVRREAVQIASIDLHINLPRLLVDGDSVLNWHLRDFPDTYRA